MKFESKDNSQMRAVGQVYGTANLGDQTFINGPKEITVSGVGD